MNQFLIVMALAFATAATLPAARAAGNCSAQFKADGKIIPNALIRRGYRSFGPLSMGRLLQQINSVQVTPDTHLLGSMDLRSTARWSKDEYGRLKVQIDCAWYMKFGRKSRAILAFHEYLWSLGIYDEIYWVSMGGYLLTENLTHQALRKDEVQQVETWITQIATKSGGVVGVGGGGEIETVECKANPILAALRQMKDAKTAEDRERGWLIFQFHLIRDQNCISGHRMDNTPRPRYRQ